MKYIHGGHSYKKVFEYDGKNNLLREAFFSESDHCPGAQNGKGN
jgi:hypothetical protein